MTHDIVQSDVELAFRLRDEQRTDEEIIAALVQRRVDPAKAAQFVDDLRNGRKVTAQVALPTEMSLARRSGKRSTSRGPGQGGARPAERAEARPQPPAQRVSREGNSSAAR